MEEPAGGGLATQVVHAPPRRPVITVSPSGDSDTRADQIPLARAESEGPASGDTASGDTAPENPVEALEPLYKRAPTTPPEGSS
jgi:hypothetical protein